MRESDERVLIGLFRSSGVGKRMDATETGCEIIFGEGAAMRGILSATTGSAELRLTCDVQRTHDAQAWVDDFVDRVRETVAACYAER